MAITKRNLQDVVRAYLHSLVAALNMSDMDIGVTCCSHKTFRKLKLTKPFTYSLKDEDSLCGLSLYDNRLPKKAKIFLFHDKIKDEEDALLTLIHELIHVLSFKYNGERGLLHEEKFIRCIESLCKALLNLK